MIFRILAIALTIFALNYTRVNLCAAAAPGKSALTKLRISQSAVNARSAILWIAQGQGIFAKHGVEVETIYLRNRATCRWAALATGDVQIASSGGAPVLSAVSGGQDLKIVASPSNRLAYDGRSAPRDQGSQGSARQTLRRHQYRRHHVDGRHSRSRTFGFGYRAATKCASTPSAIRPFSLKRSKRGNIDATLLDPFLSQQDETKRAYRSWPAPIAPKFRSSTLASSVSGNYLRDHAEVVENVVRAFH